MLTPNNGSYTIDGWNAVDGEYVDISTSGSEAIFIDEDDTSQQLRLGFDFIFYGATHNDVFVSSNGFLTFFVEDLVLLVFIDKIFVVFVAPSFFLDLPTFL